MVVGEVEPSGRLQALKDAGTTGMAPVKARSHHQTIEQRQQPGNRHHGDRGKDRGAWYAAFDLSTSQAEVAWHKWVELVEVDWTEESVTYDHYLADFGGEFHDARGDPTFQKCLDPDSYVESELLAEPLLRQGSPGITYPSVRRKGGICLACFRPALVSNVRKTARYRFTWTGAPTPAINPEETYM